MLSRFEKEFGSKNGFQTRVWGPPAWVFLHFISLNYDEKRSRGYFQFFNSLKHVLPCGKCRDNYTKIITKGPLKLKMKILENRKTLNFWLFKVHNKVQRDIYARTKKKNDIPPFNNNTSSFYKAMKIYEKYRAVCHKKSYGCIKPVKGIKKCAQINIVPLFKFHKRKLL